MKKFIFVELFAVFAISTVFGVTYDDPFARYKMWPMASAAYSNNPGLCVKDNFANAELKNQYTYQCDIIKNDTCSGFTAVSHSDKAIILSFRGSTSSSQVTNEVIEEILGPLSPFIGGGGVNKYFFDGFEDLWDIGMRDDFLALKNTNPGYELWVTGHSLGAALASIAAGTISKLGYIPSQNIKLVTFGQPRVGNESYAAAIDKLIPYAIRIVHAHDLIPHLPPEGLLGYYHHKTEVWYNNNMTLGSPYTICDVDEGEGCSNSGLDLSINDHHYYFNVNDDFAVNGCPGYNPNH